MERTAPTTLFIGAGLGIVVGFVLQVALAGLSLPRLRPEYTLVVTLVLVAVVVVALALPVRRSTRGARRAPVDPFFATRVVVLAKATAITGALLTGAATGLLIDLLARAGTATGDTFLRVVLTLAGSGALVVAGLVAEWMCTVPPVDPDDESGPGGSVEA
jgi:hypothetical protein